MPETLTSTARSDHDRMADLPAPLCHSMDNAARRLGVGRTKFFELVAAGEVQTITVNRRRIVPERSLVEFIDRRLAEVAS